MIILTIFIATTESANAGIITLEWSDTVDSSSNVLNPTDALGVPNGNTAGFFGGFPAQATFSRFGNNSITNTNSSNLATLLGISETTLSQAEFIAFERNGTLNSPFESATWIFDDGFTSVQIVQDFNNPMTNNGIVAFGNLTNENYANFFEFTIPSGGDNPFLLFNLDGIDTGSENFRVTIDAQGTGFASPDPDALGIINSVTVTEPSFLNVFSIGMLISGIRFLATGKSNNL